MGACFRDHRHLRRIDSTIPGAPILSCVHKGLPGIFMDCHMMVAQPEKVPLILLASHFYSYLSSGLMTLRMLAAQCTASILRQQVHKPRPRFGTRNLTQPLDNPVALIDKIHKRSMKAGVAISPDTPSTAITDEVANAADMLLVMTVYPGYKFFFFSHYACFS